MSDGISGKPQQAAAGRHREYQQDHEMESVTVGRVHIGAIDATGVEIKLWPSGSLKFATTDRPNPVPLRRGVRRATDASIPEKRVRDDQPQSLLHGETTCVGLQGLGGQKTNDRISGRPDHLEDKRTVADDSIHLRDGHLIQ